MVKKLLLVCVLFIITRTVYGQKDLDNIMPPFKCDTIRSGKFEKLVQSKLKDIRKKNEFSTDELLDLIRIRMSAERELQMNPKKLYLKFLRKYWLKIVPIASNDKSLGYVPLKGMVGYSSTYKMYITPPVNRSDLPCYNYYVIKYD